MTTVLLALGSNVGDALEFLRAAAIELGRELQNAKASPIYRTAPMYVIDQSAFLNAALVGKTSLGPLPLLHWTKALEKQIGRQDSPRFGPREIDIDLIAYGRVSYRFQEAGETLLHVPHSRIRERRFVLQPLADIAPDTSLPGLGTVLDLLEKTNDQIKDVVKLSDAVLPIHSSG